MKNSTLRRRVSSMFDRDAGDDAILDLISSEIAFLPCQQAIIDRFCSENSFGKVLATDEGRSTLLEAITNANDGNEEEFEQMMNLHEALEDDTRWMLQMPANPAVEAIQV